MKIKFPKIELKTLVALILLVIIVFAVTKSRLSVIPELVADYDPWWFYRHAVEILENNLIPPKWDELSFYPPGRPFPTLNGWLYFIIIFYKITSIFTSITFMKAAIISPAIMTGLSAIAAYLLGKELSNEWGGLVTAIFATMTPAFIGVSIAGYLDTDAVVAFFSFLSVYSIFLAMKHRKWYYIALATLANFAFIYSWFFGWYVILFFSLLIPVFFGYRVLRDFLLKRRKIELTKIVIELKNIFWPFIIIFIITNVIGFAVGLGTVFQFIQIASGFRLGGGGVIVNVSVAELQPINVLTKGGFNVVADRIGRTPMFLMLFGLPLLVIYKLYKKEKIGFEEIFLFMWAAITFYIILNGVRFALLFSVAVAASSGYVIGNVINYLADKNLLLKSSVFGIIIFMVISYLSQNLAYAMNIGGFDIGQNWVDMLEWLKNNADKNAIVSTWWDPGHIIAGYTGLRVHADGAHCSPSECIPYNHNDRIQDMGRIMSTSNETEALTLLKKYMQLTPEQCELAKEKWSKIIPDNVCGPASEMYFISSSDLIGKFTWMNYFGGYRAPIGSPEDFQKNPGVCCASTPATEPGQMSCGEFATQGRGLWVWCPWIFGLQNVQQDREGNNVLVYDYGGLKLSLVEKPDALLPIYNNRYLITEVVFFNQNGALQKLDLSTYPTNLEKINGMIWLQPDFRSGIYFSSAIKDSTFVKTFFFNGQGLENFEFVYGNPEIRVYKINFENN